MVLAMFVVSLFVGIFAVFLIEYAAKTGRKAEGSRE
jgi:ABC-type phosphate transport system permease subunit